MTKEEALAEAQRRWGAAGKVYDRAEHPDLCWTTTKGQKWVGAPDLGMPSDVSADGTPIEATHPYGNGYTWEECFSDADRRRAL